MKVRWNGEGTFVTTDGVNGYTFSPDEPEQEVSDELGAFLCARHRFEEVEPEPEPEPVRAKRSRKEEPEPEPAPEPVPEPEPEPTTE